MAPSTRGGRLALLLLTVSRFLAGPADGATNTIGELTFECPPGWTIVGPDCYMLSSSPLDNNDAQDICRRYGSELVNVRDEIENGELADLVKNKTAWQEFWVHNANEMEWERICWDNGEPREPAPPDSCVASSNQGLVSLRSCLQSLPFVCRFPACLAGSHRCGDGRCINSNYRCDGEFDCSDDSDENNCTSNCTFVQIGSFGEVDGTSIYRNNAHCQWLLEAPVGKQIKVEFPTFALEAEGDRLEVWAGGRSLSDSRLLATLTGNSPRTLLSPNHLMTLRLLADASTTLQGFRASWTSDVPEASKAVRNMTAMEAWTDLTSPFYGQGIASDFRQEWLISAPTDTPVSLEVLELGLSGQWSVRVLEGEGYWQQVQHLTSAPSLPWRYVSASSLLRLILSASASSGRGFKARFKKGCNLEIQARNGVLESPGFPWSRLPRAVTCQWQIVSPDGRALSLIFDRFNLTDSSDSVNVTDGGSLAETRSGTSLTPAGSRLHGLSPLNVILASSRVAQTGVFRAEFSIDCPPLPNTTFMMLSTNATSWKTEVNVSCQEGYQFRQEEFHNQESLVLTCLRGGVWDRDRLPTCQVAYCGVPNSIENGAIYNTSGSVTYGSRATYTCDPGFQMSGSPQASCNAMGRWEGVPSCQTSTCSAVPTVNNGNFTYVDGAGQAFASIVQYKCHEGYELLGAQRLLCDTGNWSHTPPSCQRIQCPKPEVANGEVTVGSSWPIPFETQANLTCHEGFRVNSTRTPRKTVSCKSDMSFGDEICLDVDECESDPCILSTCENTIGSFRCVCLPGTTTKGPLECEDVDECTTDNGGCSHNCSNTQGSYHCGCPPGLTLYSQNFTSRLPLPSGEDGSRPKSVLRLNHTCVPMLCQPPPNISHGYLFSKRSVFRFEDEVQYRCEEGYVLDRSYNVSCLEDGSWTTPPNCSQLMCDPLTVMGDSHQKKRVVHLHPNASVSLGESVVLGCRGEDGQTTNRTLYCAYDLNSDPPTLSLQGDKPECPVMTCPEFDVIPGAVQEPEKPYVIGSRFEFSCKEGFQHEGVSLLGNMTVECGNNGLWGYNNLTCKGARCSDPGTPGGATQEATSYEAGEMVSYKCTQMNNRSGYTPVPAEPLLCVVTNSTIAWNGTLPTCTDTQPPTFDHCPETPVLLDPLSTPDSMGVKLPRAQDNSGLLKPLAVMPRGFSLQEKLSASLNVTYTAQDYAGNSATCVLRFEVKDRNQVVNVSCPEHHTVELNSPDSVTLDLSALVNKSAGATLEFTPSSPLNFNLSKVDTVTAVYVTARDSHNNTAHCAFTVDVRAKGCFQEALPELSEATRDCSGNKSGLECRVTCKPSRIFLDGNTTKTYSCSGDNVWQPQVPSEDCHAHVPSEYTFKVRVAYKFQSLLFSTSGCTGPHNNSVNETVSDSSNYINRACNSKTPLSPYQFTVSSIGEDTTLDKWVSIVTLRVLNSDGDAGFLDQCRRSLNDAQYLRIFFNYTPPLSECHNMTICTDETLCPQSSDFRVLENGATCADGNALIRTSSSSVCVRCPPGTFYQNARCQTCGEGSYQNETGQSSCRPCPNSQTFSRLPRSRADHCFAGCPRGFTSQNETGQPPCQACPMNSFWANTTQCTICPSNSTTLGKEAASSSDQCVELCPPGKYSASGHLPCPPCPVNFYSGSVGAKTCMECPSSSVTPSEGATSASSCVASTACQDPSACSNHGTCTVERHVKVCTCENGYQGLHCNETVDFCRSNPCLNGATCNSSPTGYTCTCPSDVTCEMKPNGNYYVQNADFLLPIHKSDLETCKNTCLADALCTAMYYLEDSKLCAVFNKNALTEERKPSNTSLWFDKVCSTKHYFNGTNCEEDLINDCKPDTCSEFGMCQDRINGTKCLCPASGPYSPPRCQLDSDPCGNSACTNGGTCMSFGQQRFQCRCPPGYTGKTCETNIDECEANPGACLYNGTCMDGVAAYRCECPQGFSGGNCETPPDFCSPSPCPKGVCRSSLLQSGPECLCEDPFEQDDMSKLCKPRSYCTSSPCQNNGTCEEAAGGGSFTCKCPDGYEGSRCQLPVDDCMSMPCLNGGTCRDLHMNFSCDCAPGYTGRTCAVNVTHCPGTCNAPGTARCLELGTGFRCECNPGYVGRNCSEEMDECLSLPCRHGGTCQDGLNSFSCNCTAGWTGRTCQEEEVFCFNSTCKNGGECFNLQDRKFCKCPAGAKGDICETSPKLCDVISPCMQGSCIDVNGTAKCQCPEKTMCQMVVQGRFEAASSSTPLASLSGLDLAACHQRCLGMNSCNASLHRPDGSCILYASSSRMPSSEPGHWSERVCPKQKVYSGHSCELIHDPCSLNPCKNGGNCTLMDLGFMCKCPLGYYGLDCGTGQDKCELAPCPTSRCPVKEGEAVCRCPPNQVFAGGSCKAGDGNFDILLTSEAVTARAQEPMTFSDNQSLTLMFWAAFLEDTGFPLRLVDRMGDVLLSVSMTSATVYKPSKKTVYFNESVQSKTWQHFGIRWSQSGDMDFVVDSKLRRTPERAEPPLKGEWYVELGHGFLGYVSRVYVWSGRLSDEEVLKSWANSSRLESPDKLLYGWGRFSLPLGARRLTPSTASRNFQVCKYGSSSSSRLCSNPDKRAPSLKEGQTCPGEMNQTMAMWHRTVPASVLPPPPFSGKVRSTITGEALPWGAHHVITAAVDDHGNYMDCRSKLYVKDERDSCSPSGVPGVAECSTGTCLKLNCNSNQRPSRPYPRLLSCGRLDTRNCLGRFAKLSSPGCGGATTPRYRVEVKLVHRYPVGCSVDDMKLEIEKIFKNKLRSEWAGLCIDNDCTNVVVTSTCRSSRRRRRQQEQLGDTTIVIESLPATLSSSTVPQPLAPGEVLELLALERQTFNFPDVAISQLLTSMTTVKADAYCPDLDTLRDNQCVTCGKGTFFNSTSKECQPCPRGQYQSSAGQASCMDCSGKTTLTTGATALSDCVDDCKAGQFYNSSASACSACPRDFYQQMAGADFCRACPLRQRTESSATDSPAKCFDDCPSGSELQKDGNCTMCPRGTFRTQSQQDACTACPSNFTTATANSTASTDCEVRACPPGEYINGSECIPCPLGQYQPEKWEYTCRSCNDSFTTEQVGAVNASQCKFYCPAGKELVNGTCTPCRRGFYRSGQVDHRFQPCQPCGSPNITEETGADSTHLCNLAKCSAGTKVSADRSSCELCPQDTYQHIAMPTSATTCTPCSEGLGTMGNGSSSEADCKPVCGGGQQYSWEDRRCKPCPMGSYKEDSDRFGNCTKCPHANFTTNGTGANSTDRCNLRDCLPGTMIVGNDCVSCPNGTYQDKPRQTMCRNCSSNTTTDGEGKTSPQDCQVHCGPGLQGNDTCEACPEDTFKSEAGVSPCQQCQGSLTSNSSRTTCDVLHCDRGFQYNATTSSCSPCPMGFYKDSRGNDAHCQPCPVNYTTVNKAADSRDNCSELFCEPGTYKSGGSCQPCPKGTYKSSRGNEQCMNCSMDRTTSNTGARNEANCSIRVCSVGSFRETSNNTCLQCPLNTYQEVRGSQNCNNCSQGFITFSTGSNSPDDCYKECLEGNYRHNRTSCLPCDKGTYQDKKNVLNCTACPPNFTTNGTGSEKDTDCFIECSPGEKRTSRGTCEKCLKGEYQPDKGQESCQKCSAEKTTLHTGSNSSSDCYPICAAGNYLNVSSRSCRPCPLGTYQNQNGTSQSCTECPRGNTTSNTGSMSLADCNKEDCLPGHYRASSSGGCLLCEYGTYQTNKSQSSCKSCPMDKTTLMKGATRSNQCFKRCEKGKALRLSNSTCLPCKLGFYKNDSMIECVKCPPGQTTIQTGSDRCTSGLPTSTVAPLPPKTYKVDITFELASCQNGNLMKYEMSRAIEKILEVASTVYSGLYRPKLRILFKFEPSNPINCNLPRRRRRQAETNRVTVQAALEGLSELVEGPSGAVPTEDALEKAFAYIPEEVTTQLEDKAITIDNTLIKVTFHPACSPGLEIDPAGNACVNCPAGKYRNDNQLQCEECSADRYQDQAGQASCKSCPPNTNTTGMTGRTSAADCKSGCTFSPDFCYNGGTCVPGDTLTCLCRPEYTGTRCETREVPQSSNSAIIGGTIGGIGGALFLILLVVGVIYCVSDRTKKKAKKRRSAAASYASGAQPDYAGDYADSQILAPYAGWTPFPHKEAHAYHTNPIYSQEFDFYQSEDDHQPRSSYTMS